MSSIPYSGGTIVDSTYSGTTRANIASGLIAALVSAGWTSVAGSSTDQTLESATTSTGQKIRMRVWDPGSGNCAKVTMKNAAGTLTSQEYFLNPGAGKTFTIIACKYNFFTFTLGATPAREFIAGGTLYVPSAFTSYITGELGWIHGNATTDSDTNARCSLRTSLAFYNDNGNWTGHFSGIGNATLTNHQGNGGLGSAVGPAIGQLIVRTSASTYSYTGGKWPDGTIRTHEAELAWGGVNLSDNAFSWGFIHNCMYVANDYAGDDRTITSYDSHNWFAITRGNNVGGRNQNTNGYTRQGTLFVAVT